MNGLFPTTDEWKLGVRYGIVFLTLGLCVWKAGALIVGLLPFLLAFGLSTAIDPVVRTLSSRFRLGRGWSSFLVILLLLGIGGTVATWGTAYLITATANFLEDFPHYRETVVQFVQDVMARASEVFATLPPSVAQWITENTSQLGEGIEQILTTVAISFFGLLRAVPSVLTAGLIIPLATFFISKDLPQITKLIWSVIPRDDRQRIGTVIGELWAAAWNYLRAVVILVSLTTVLATTGLFIVGIDNWFAAGLTIGLLDFLPVVGPTVAFIPWILYHIIVGNIPLALSLLVVYGIVVGVRGLIEAKVIGDSIGVHPLAMLIALFLGAVLFGVKGAILGPAALLLGKAVYTAWKRVESLD